MNIILNADAIKQPLTGVGHYALQLARGLAHHPAVDDIRFFSAYRWVTDPEQALSVNQPLAQARKRIPFKSLVVHVYHWGRTKLFYWQTRPFKDYVLHSPNYILMPFPGPSVTTVHDLSHIHYPHYHPRERIAFIGKNLPRSLAQASAVITVSEFVRQELIDILNVPADKIKTISLGVESVFHPRDRASAEGVLNRYSLAYASYLLVVATLEPRKNLLRLVEAYSRLTPSLRNHYPLVLVGAEGWLNEDLEKQLKPLERENQVRRLGYVPQQDLPFIYAGAKGFAFPSIYEGFGLPVLEAMASGVPVLTSDRASLPEVAGEAALLINPEDVEAISDGLERLLTDEDWRSVAIGAGIRQAQQFSWQRCVNETVNLYGRVLREFNS